MTHPESAPADARAFWEDRYSALDAVWRFRPNAVLAAEVPALPVGRALDLGAGEGGDSVWLAERGWTVTGVDISSVALERGAAAAAERGVAERVTWLQADLTTWQPEGAFDLVTAHFLQSPVALDGAAIARAAAVTIVPGGHLLVVQHAGHPVSVGDSAAGQHEPGQHELEQDGRTQGEAAPYGVPADGVVPRMPSPHGEYATAAELLRALDLPEGAWAVEIAELRPRTASFPDGREVLVDDVVVLARRR